MGAIETKDGIISWAEDSSIIFWNYTGILLDKFFYITQSDIKLSVIEKSLLMKAYKSISIVNIMNSTFNIEKEMTTNKSSSEFIDISELSKVGYGRNSLDQYLLDTIENNNLKIIKSLIKSGANLNFIIDKDIEPEDWETPLDKAVQMGNLKIVELLIQNGANIHQEAAWGGSPYDYAKENNLYEIINIFEEYKSLNHQTQEYKEPFETLLLISKGLAINYNNSEEIKLSDLLNALHSVEFSSETKEIFKQFFGNNMGQLNEDTDGYELIELAKQYDIINYDNQVKDLVQKLKEIFGDDLILNIRSEYRPIIDIDNDEIPF